MLLKGARNSDSIFPSIFRQNSQVQSGSYSKVVSPTFSRPRWTPPLCLLCVRTEIHVEILTPGIFFGSTLFLAKVNKDCFAFSHFVRHALASLHTHNTPVSLIPCFAHTFRRFTHNFRPSSLDYS